MEFQHKGLAGGKWQQFSLAEQLAHIGSEVSRASRWEGKDEKLFWGAVGRALELFYLTLADSRHRSRLKEPARLHELFCDAALGGKEYNTKLKDLESYFFYFAIFSKKQKNNPCVVGPVDISIVVTTRNEEKNIQNCLESIKRQTYPQEKIEIITVDNNSTDKTKEISLRYTNKVYNFGPERSAQRNYGVSQASGKYILYLDADMALSEGVISECVEKCEKEGLAALYVPERIIGRGFWIKVRDFERSFYNATCIDAVRFVRKDKFLEIGGFDETLTGPEDWDFDRRINTVGQTAIIEAPVYHNEGNFCLREYVKGKLYYARTFDRYISKWGKDDLTVRKQLGFRYRYFAVFFGHSKWKILLRRPLLMIGLYILRFIVGIALCRVL